MVSVDVKHQVYLHLNPTVTALPVFQMADLDAVSAPSIQYPYKMIWDINKDRRNPWNPTPYV